MAGYTRQSTADIIPNETVKSAPINAEYNAIRDAFAASGGHSHDGSTGEGAPIPLISDVDGNNKVVVDTANNRVSIYTEVGGAAVEQIRIQDGAIVPVTDDDIDLGASGAEFKNLYIDGTANIDALVSAAVTITGGTINDTVIGNTTPAAATFTTATTTGQATLASAAISGGTIDGNVIGGTTPSAGTFTNLTANTGITGDLTGDVTGNLTGNVTGNVTGDVTGDLTGNVTASTGASTFNNVTVNGTLDVTGTTIANVTDPSSAQDAATKNYVDTNDALKLNLSGGTMSGAIAMGTNKITGLGTPTDTADAATKGYVDTQVSNLVDAAPGALDTLNELAAAIGDDANFSTTITNSIATKLPLAGGTMTGDITMGANAVTSTADPSTDDELSRKGYVDTQDALKLDLSGGTMSGAIAMGTSKITGLGDPTANQDAATKAYVDTADAGKLSLSGGTMTGNIVLGSNKATSTATPTADDDLTRKGYVDTILGSATAAATSAANAATSESNAATSASNAATSETNAANSATAAATSASDAATSLSDFESQYIVSATTPSSPFEGMLWWDSANDTMKVYDGGSFVLAGSAVNGTSGRQTYTLTSPNDTFAAVYDVGFVDVYLNGVKLLAGTDFTATNGTSVVLASNAVVGDVVDIVTFGAFSVADTYSQATIDSLIDGVGSYTITRTSITATSGQTVFTASYDVGYVDVYQNGLKLDITQDFTASNGTSITLVEAAAADDVIEVVSAFGAFSVADTYTQAQADARYATAAQGALADSALQSADIGSTVQAYDADTAKTDVANTFTADQTISGELTVDSYNESYAAVTSSSNATTIDCEAGNVFSHTLSENTTFTFSNPPASGTAYAFSLRVVQDASGSGYTLTWPTSVDWAAATAPTLTADADAVDWFVFNTVDGGTTWYGFTAGQALG
jgi:hypothetical protein